MQARNEQKNRTHDTIVEVAARLLRERGLHGVGLAEIMRASGLTHGGFYSHFESRDALLAEALANAAETSRSGYFAGLRDKRGLAWISSALRRYLSRGHRDHSTYGCPYPSLAVDASREGPELRAIFERELMESIAGFASHLEEAEVADAEDISLGLLALCSGGIALARAVEDPTLSDRILTACRNLAADSLNL